MVKAACIPCQTLERAQRGDTRRCPALQRIVRSPGLSIRIWTLGPHAWGPCIRAALLQHDRLSRHACRTPARLLRIVAHAKANDETNALICQILAKLKDVDDELEGFKCAFGATAEAMQHVSYSKLPNKLRGCDRVLLVTDADMDKLVGKGTAAAVLEAFLCSRAASEQVAACCWP